MLKVATTFSGIGAIEHALERLGIPCEIVFACDNGGVEPFRNIKTDEIKGIEKELKQVSDLVRATELQNRIDRLREEEIHRIETEIFSLEDHIERKDYVDKIYSNSKQTNFVEKSYFENYEIDKDRFYQDVKYLKGDAYRGEVDLFVGGSPCQSFSVAGRRGGFEDTRGTLFYEYARLVNEIKPKVFIYENVRGLIQHDKGKTWEVVQNTFDDLGYKYYHDVLTPTNYGIPQSRNRVFVVGFREDVEFTFPEKRELLTTMQDYLLDNAPDKYYLTERGTQSVLQEKSIKKKFTQINGEISLCQRACQQYNLRGDFVYEPNIPEKYFLSDKLIKYVMSTGTKGFKVKPTIDTKIAKTLLATYTKMHRASIDNYVTTEGRIRRLTPRECLRLMGFCDGFKIEVSDTQMYRQAGNSIVVDVLMAIMEEVNKSMSHNPAFRK